MTISYPVLLLVLALVGVAFAVRGGSSRGSGAPGRPPWWRYDHVPWGGAEEPFHPRDRDLRDRAWDEAEAEYERRQAGGRDARMDEKYGGDFAPWPDHDA